MRATQTILMIVGCTLVLTTVAGADPTSEARKAITALDRKMEAALARKDVDGATAYCTPDCISIHSKGRKTTLAQLRQNMQRILPLMQNLKSVTTIQKISVSGKTSIVTTSDHTSALLVNPQTHASKAFAESDVDRETWIMTPQGWRMQRNEELSSHTTIDGKPVKM